MWSLEDNAVDVLTRLGADISDDELEARRTAATPLDLATLIYTSGTTGRPKGCMLTHGNFLFELGVAVPELHELFAPGDDADDASTLLFLPLAHVFARIIQVGCIKARVTLSHSSDVKTLTADLGEVRPTFVLGVPRVFEKVFNTASQTGDRRRARSPLRPRRRGRGGLVARPGGDRLARDDAGRPRSRPVPAVRAQHALFSRLVYARLREALGGRCRYAISGGAPLGDRLAHFYRGIGLTVLEGYGLTETTAALTVNLPDQLKVGTVGRPLPGTAVRVDDDGELLFRGGQVFAGYWGDEAATSEALDRDGWFRSGDLGEVDDEGFVRITGRKKEILVTAGGKNVAPGVLEDRVRSHAPGLAVPGRRRRPAVHRRAGDPRRGRRHAHGLATWARAPASRTSSTTLTCSPRSRAPSTSANTVVSRAESIRRFTVLPRDWTEEGGQLTPSLKLKRNVVLREAKDDIAGLYLS